MSGNLPFGFTPPGDDDGRDGRHGPPNPFGFRSGGPGGLDMSQHGGGPQAQGRVQGPERAPRPPPA